METPEQVRPCASDLSGCGLPKESSNADVVCEKEFSDVNLTSVPCMHAQLCLEKLEGSSQCQGNEGMNALQK